MWQSTRWFLAIGAALAVPGMLAAAGVSKKTPTTQPSAEARLATAETYLAEKNYTAARAACAQVRGATKDAQWIARAQMLFARSYLQQRNYPAARRELGKLLAIDGLDHSLKWEAEALLGATGLVSRLRVDHPRLFFNAETWPAIKARTLTVEKASFDRLKTQVDRIPLEEIRSGDWALSESAGVMEAAFVYRVTGDPAVLEKVRRMLWGTADLFAKGRGHGERASPNVAWLAALDWVWNDLVPSEREVLADAMLRYACRHLAERRAEKGGLEAWPHYYMGSMFAFAGIALLEPSLDDVAYAQALSLLGIGFKHHQERFASLLRTAGDDGMWQTNIEYDLVEVPVPVFAFLYAWQPATGAEMPAEWATVGVSPHVALRMVVGMGKNHVKHLNYAGHSNGAWGFGQVYSSALYDHLGHYMHFFGRSHPQEAAIAHELRRKMVETGAGPGEGRYPVFRFLMTDFEKAPSPAAWPAELPLARFFASVGLVVMSSGFGPDDTYALFSQGGGVVGRRHDYDATHFSIFKKGYLALDTGARFALPHSPNYRHQTVAHNCVLIQMPGERFPPSATGPVVANTGGQNRWPHDARPLAFQSDRHYAYTAVDATPVYHADKCGQMVRQFLYLPPDHFVVFDRVTSKRAEYAKTWLLHTANEPVIAGKQFRAEQDQGRIFCRTLYPADAVLEKIGGPGKEFWADGRNWAIVDRFQSPGSGDWWKQYGHGYTEPPEAMGRWRVEVRPGTARTDDVLLHLIQVSGQADAEMVASRVREQGDRIELTFTAASRACTIALNKTGDVGGHLQIAEGDKLVVDRDLTGEIMPQAGLALANDSTNASARAGMVEDNRHAAAGKKDVPALLQQLTAKTRVTLDQDARSVAAVELVGLGKLAVEPLVAAMADPSPEVRRRVTWALGEIRDPRAVAVLAKTLHDQDDFVRSAAGESLTKIGPPAVDGLIAALDSPEAGVRITAAHALGRIADPHAAERLAAAVEGADPAVCREAIWALGQIKDRRGVPALMHAVKSDDPRTREFAVWALGATGEPAIGTLIAALADPSAETRGSAVRALGTIGKPAATPLMAALKAPSEWVRAGAAEALGVIGQADAIPALLPLLNDADTPVRRRAIEALGKLADARAVEPLLAALRDPDPEVRRGAADGLGRAKDGRAVEPLMVSLKDENPLVRRAAVEALGGLGDRRAVGPAIGALQDADRLVRLAAARALGQIKDPRAIEPLIEAIGDPFNAVGYEANTALYALTGHKLDIPTGWNANTLRTYRLPIWRRWWEENKAKFGK